MMSFRGLEACNLLMAITVSLLAFQLLGLVFLVMATLASGDLRQVFRVAS
jgi:hypothetical protein